MKKLLLLALSGALFSNVHAQAFSGLSTGNYSGVNGLFSNPANVADSRYRFDINLFSMQALAANDQASFTLRNIYSNFKGDSLSNQVFGKNAGAASGMLQLEFRGPSVMFNVAKNGFAITPVGACLQTSPI